jgi:hypothetical protein
MDAAPAEFPMNEPGDAATPNTATAPLLHAPPAGVAVKVALLLTHTTSGPVTADGVVFTDNARVAKQPVDAALNEIVTAPASKPVTVPEPVGTVATSVSLLLHVPPTEFVSKTDEPSHTKDGPLIDGGVAETLTTAVLKQPSLMR